MANDHYTSAENVLHGVGRGIDLARDAEKAGNDPMPTLVSTLIAAVSAVAHSQLAMIDMLKTGSLTPLVHSSEIEPRPKPTEPAWHPGDNEPAKHVASLEYHAYSPERPTPTLRKYLHQQSGGGWLWSTEPVSTRIADREGLPWKRATDHLDGYFTEVHHGK
jgi:hypothetical protein